MELRGAGVLVTGASSGIGAAVAVTLARAGARLALCARRTELLQAVASSCLAAGAPTAHVLAADLADVDGVPAVAARADELLGAVDVVVNNAGIPKRRNVTRLTMAEVDEVLTLNYRSPVALTLALLPGMVARGRGLVVSIGSLAGRVGSPREAAYSGSKFALTGFCESAQVDCSGTGVAFAVVQPGPIATDIWDRSLPGNEPPLYAGEMFPPSDVADAVLAAITAGGFERFIPPEMQQVVAYKATDIDAFLAGSAAFAAQSAGTEDPAAPPGLVSGAAGGS